MTPMEARYLNTDLEIESKQDLSPIVEEFGEDVSVLHQWEFREHQHASFEIAGSSLISNADDVISFFCSLVDNLPPSAREIWDGCSSRIFDIGYQSGTEPHSFRSEIRASTIQRAADIGASIVITIYPVPPVDERPAEGDPAVD